MSSEPLITLEPVARSQPIPLGPWKRNWTLAISWLKFAVRYLLASLQPSRWQSIAAPAIAIENTSVCNSRCVFCPNGIMQRPRQAMSTDVFKKTVDDSIAIGARDIDFSVMIGDPLLDPRLLERARYLRTYPHLRDMGFTTTLQWLHLFDIDEFFDCRFTWITVSTTLSGPERYHDFFGVDHYDQMLANLVTLLKENNRRGNPLIVNLSIKPTPEPRRQILNHPDFQLVQSLTTQNLRKIVKREAFFVMDWGGGVQLPSFLRLYPLWPRKRRPCGRLLQFLMVYSNGKVGACNCVDYEASSDLILGDIREQSLGEMWKGPQLQQMRDDWRAGTKIPIVCQFCRMYRPGPAH
ncbi:MAG: SPASM domain-containing protein [Terracidiphilus sp.]|nr:SPASM domain-containing protein [Terracidiphilus sp.]